VVLCSKLEEGQTVSFDGKTLITDLGDVGGCKAKAGLCTADDGIILWDDNKFKEVCPLEFKGRYTAILSNKHVIVDELQAAIMLTVPYSGCTNEFENALETKQGLVLKIHGHKFSVAPMPHYRKQSTESSLNIMKLNTTFNAGSGNNSVGYLEYRFGDPVNLKLNYLEYKLVQMENENFQQTWMELCHHVQRYLDLVWQFLHIDATLGIRALLQRTDIVAAFTGDVITVWPCRKVNVTHIFTSYKVGKQCYKYMPVILVKDQLMFVLPGSIDLVAESPEVDCNHRIHSIFKTSNGYETEQGRVHVNKLTMEVIWKNRTQMFQFDSPAVFHEFQKMYQLH